MTFSNEGAGGEKDSSPINDSLNGTSATPTPSGTAPAPLQSSTISNPVNPTEISPVKNTGLALAAWFSDTEGADSNSSPNMQLFYQAKSGGLRSRLYAPNSGWSNETIFLNSSCTPKPQTPLAQMNWGPASTRERSLVFINGQGTICDLTTQQGNETMVEGTLEKVGFQAGKLSRITAQFWEDTHTFFYQDPNDNVIQISYNASWPSWKLQKSYNGVTGLYRGSGIASYSYSASDSSSSSSSSTSIVVEGIVGQGQEGETYTSNTTMTALNWKSSQILGSGMVPGGVPLTASTQTALDGSLRNIQLFWVKSGSVNTMVYSNQTTGGSEFSWGDPAVLATGAGDNTTVAAFIWNSGSQGLLYFQDNSGGISEMKMSTPGAWKVTDFKI